MTKRAFTDAALDRLLRFLLMLKARTAKNFYLPIRAVPKVLADFNALIAEVRRLRSLLDRVYSHVVLTPGTETLQAELELEVLAIREAARRKAAH